MPTIIRPVVIDSCQTTLRGRRRSSVHPVPKIFMPVTSAPEDDSAPSQRIPLDHLGPQTPTTLSLPSNAHLPDFATKFTIPRHFDTSISPMDIASPVASPLTSPATSPPITPCVSRRASFSGLLPEKNEHIQSQKQERLKWRLAAGFFAYFLSGWGDGVTATVMPYLMEDFHLSSMTLSLLYLGTTVGFAFGTFTAELFLNFLGQFNCTQPRSWLMPASPYLSKIMDKKISKDDIRYSPSQARFLSLMLGCILNATFFALMALRTGFPAMFAAYAAAAIARSLWTVPLNAYFAQGPKQCMGVSYGLWSLGSVAAPFVAQSLIAKGTPWPRFYWGSMTLCAFNLAFLCLTYHPTNSELDGEGRAAIIDKGKSPEDSFPAASLSTPDDGSCPSATSTAPKQTLRLALSIPRHWTLLLTGMMYTGSETCTIAFMVTFLLEARHANHNSAGYVTSGFWGGITIGRMLWGYISPRFTFRERKYFVQANLFSQAFSLTGSQPLIALALVMHLLIWLTTNVFGDAFSASLIGLLYGPVFPAMLSMATDILPSEVHLVSMALVSTSASIGGALFPFVLGTFMNIKGARYLSYMNVPLALTLAALWGFLPSRLPYCSG